MIRQWNVNTAKKLKEWKLPAAAFDNFKVEPCLSPDGKLLASMQADPASKRPIVCLHETVTGTQLRYWPALKQLPDAVSGAKLRNWPPSEFATGACVFSRDGKLLATALPPQEVCVWEAATGKELGRWKLDAELLLQFRGDAFAFAPDGASMLISERYSFTLVQWDRRTGKCLRRYPGTQGPIALFPDGKRMAVERVFGAITVLDASTGKDVCPLPCAGMDSRSRRTAQAGLHRKRRARPCRRRHRQGSASLARRCRVGQPHRVRAGRQHPRDLRRNSVRLWDAAHDRPRRSLEVRDGVRWLSFSPDGRRLASGKRNQAWVWDLNTGKTVRDWRGSGDFAMAPGWRSLAIADERARRLRLVDPVTGKTLSEASGVSGRVRYHFVTPTFHAGFSAAFLTFRTSV